MGVGASPSLVEGEGVGGGVGAELPQAAMTRSVIRRVVMGRRSLVGGMVSLVYAEGPHPIPFLRPPSRASGQASTPLRANGIKGDLVL